jgi:hypothetical protein
MLIAGQNGMLFYLSPALSLIVNLYRKSAIYLFEVYLFEGTLIPEGALIFEGTFVIEGTHIVQNSELHNYEQFPFFIQ